MLLPTPVVSRLAPTPSGFLHLGNAVNFTLTWLLTRRAGGTLHLRIDDLDRARFRPAYLDNIFRTLEWLGLDYDAGPTGPDDFERHYSQRHFLPAYEAVLQQLALVPGLVQASTRSRTGVTPAAAAVPLDMPGAAWRVQMPGNTKIRFLDAWQGETAVPLGQLMPDFVVRKKDGAAAYQVASVADDLRLGTTLVVRGLDLLPSTAAQLWLARQLPSLAAFQRVQLVHHGLLPGPDGHKLSKSTQASTQRGIVAEAAGPQVVYEAVARLLGLPEIAGESLRTLLQALNDSPLQQR
jgi:glutamyl/glutaminyl-tRNA synthetase